MMSHLVLGLFEMKQTYSFLFVVVNFHFDVVVIFWWVFFVFFFFFFFFFFSCCFP